MSSLVEAFDILLVGDEPAAYWWMEKSLSYTKAFPKDGKKTFSVPRMAHLSLRSEREVPLPLTIAKRFGIPFRDAHEIECIFPERLVSWNKANFSQIREGAFVPTPKTSDLASVRFHLAESPELLAIAQGLWRIFGRSESQLPDLSIWNAFQLSPYTFWTPSPVPGVRHISSADLPTAHWLRTDSHGNFELEMASGATVSAPYLVVAVNGNELEGIRTKCPDLAPYFISPGEFLSYSASYQLTLGDVDPRLLKQLKPLSILFEDTHLPMAEETHTIRVHHEKKTITIEFQSPFDFSLEAVSQAAAHAYRQLIHLIPDLKLTPHTIGLPLAGGEIESEEDRLRAIRTFQLNRKPRYRSTTTHSRTLHPHVHLFTPFLKCQYAYPFGQLESASKHLQGYFGKRRYRKSTHAVEGAAFFS